MCLVFHYHELSPLPSLCAQAVAEYIWLDNDGQIRSRTKVLEGSVPQEAEALPCLVVDGRVPGDSESADELYEVVLRPRKIFKDPFRSGSSILVLCDAYEPPAVSWGILVKGPWPLSVRVLCMGQSTSLRVLCAWPGLFPALLG